MFKRILIANRGEIACRIARSCRRLGIETVAVHSHADANALHVRSADRAVALTGDSVAAGYLDIAQIVDAARDSGCEAIHPGYGFLAENADFALACEAADICFIGPGAEAIRSMGDKAQARRLAREVGVAVIPGVEETPTESAQDRDQALCSAAAHLEYPLMVKACAGGGGRGMRRVDTASELAAAIAIARREAMAGFGNDALIVERYIARPRHIEVQILGDTHGNLLHLHERDCSTQRRHQKLIEEAPAPGLAGETRNALHQAALSLARAIGYENAGTVEFILDTHDQSFFFLEVNTRLQVEHPVTEAILGLDLVEWQIRIAAGEALPFTQQNLRPRGWAMEARINAEDPAEDFRPATGTVHYFRAPDDVDVRLDSAIEQGSMVEPYYDSMLGKLIVHGHDRAQASARLADALRSMSLMGVRSNIAFLAELVRLPAFRNADVSTAFIAEHFADGWQPRPSRHDLAMAAAWILIGDHDADLALEPRLAVAEINTGDPKVGRSERARESEHGPWHRLGSFRLLGAAGHPGRWRLMLDDDSRAPIAVWVENHDDALHMVIAEIGAPPPSFETAIKVRAHFADSWLELRLDDRLARLDVVKQAGTLHLYGTAGWHAFRELDASEALTAGDGASGALNGPLLAPVPGVVASIEALAGDVVPAGAAIVVLESMKMYQTLFAPVAAKIIAVHCAAGDAVTVGQALVTLEAAEQAQAQPQSG